MRTVPKPKETAILYIEANFGGKISLSEGYENVVLLKEWKILFLKDYCALN